MKYDKVFTYLIKTTCTIAPSMAEPFIFPKIHSFPPLYTKQPNLTVQEKQLESWSDLILNYCQHYRVTSLSQAGLPLTSQNSQLKLDQLPSIFENKSIDRQVNDEFKNIIFKYLVNKLHKAEYINVKKKDEGIFVWWKPLLEWASCLYNHMNDTGQTGTVFTIFELTSSNELGLPESLRNIDSSVMIRILRSMVKQGRTQLIMEDGEIGGVKFI